ncbi:glycoside hydrolase family 47 protein [Mycena olivaceomarginata]|nr:glycoside hydrolase family 47 protein [Mycena olivaceomarginata]
MRRRTIQYIGLLFIVAVVTHLYFLSPSDSPRLDSEWNDDNDELGGSESQAPLTADVHRRGAVVAAFQYAWSAYERDAMGSDEYHPISHRGTNLSTSGGIGYTVVDAIDTMLLMGLHQEYSRASNWVRNHLSFDRDGQSRCFNTFETTIRVLGGLLSALHLTSDDMYLRHAVDLADRMLPAFDTPSGLPMTSVNLKTSVGIQDPGNHISTAEATTLQLEFRDLAQLTKNDTYWYKAEKVMAVVKAAHLPSNLAPISMNANDGSFSHSEIRLGSRGDSYYEYLLKQWLQTDRTEPVYLKMYEDTMLGIHNHLVQTTPTRKLTYIAELFPKGADWRTTWDLNHKQDHLVCFLAGSLMLGATTAGSRGAVSVPPKMDELTRSGQRDWKTGVELLEGCMATHETATGLSPEIVQFQPSADQPERDWYIKGSRPGGPASYDARYMLRPETVESLFLAWRLTGNKRYRDYSWGIFQAIEKHCRLESGGYATVLDVDTVPVRHDDKQETFYLSETLKYLFLTFADESVLLLDGYVFNTEAHPLPVFRPSIQPMFTL